ncbi:MULTISPECIES: 2Fe-2S iron-sulfur cluster-binding protein [unclassified Pseudomonas]|uniref:2Fe-2S iron-sulfur cluster-binding protein n=1 Tax=unclassified Pseudomonas TaxID=196821 RepID=UPI000BC37342|nr:MULTISPECIES: 2Fe-2S iron-sulfur cluster-binding protein [unclassified Pseudomonas]PVZ20648.1 N-methylglutamate dehydrogenase subunit C [Pseudomonas sp. URIL14HWK12:I12]PVZ27714.1 N-methylglutamate dehydrogenase subunit C [Pseudomonas sp. URIL14HWK12:I10]PVZ38603.1 N-methylglutamate dehydrogenase subunit C [Pseudomonas sp. URIL14HWK12:I11]SNZ02700.1 N-methylglutamate dehydrogenase subunit C [Pseudomonas sp. URIL14HWK12:I9]
MSRLPAPMGLLIDRTQTLGFTFEGVTYQGLQGDTLASALYAAGQPLLSRSFKYHRPRGVLTLAGQDANSLVQLPREPNVLADTLPVSEGLSASAQNCNGTLAYDKDAYLGKFSRFMPVGFYYRAFYKPQGAWKRWEPLIRKKAGLGVLDLSFTPEYYDKAYLFADLLVIGAGPAGLQAALTAADAGAQVLLVDENRLLGGALTYARFDLQGQRAQALRTQLITQVQAHANIRVLSEATANGWFADNYVPVIQHKRMYKVRARQCIAACGAFDQPVVFRNNDLPGVMLTSAAQRLMRLYAVKPGERAVVLTGNDDGYLAALDLHEQGVQVAALVDMRPQADDPALAAAASRAGIDIKLNSTVYEALHGKGGKRVTGVDIRRIEGQGQVAGAGETIGCDLLCMSAGYMPVYQLLCQAGGKLAYDDASAGFTVSGLPPVLRIAGSTRGVQQLDNVLADGLNAALQALQALELPCSLRPASLAREPGCNFPWPIFPHPKGKDFVDFDEDLQVRDIVNATRSGYRDVQLVKRFSTVGMGPSQGRHSALPTARLVAWATQRSVSETGVTTARPPFAPEKLAHVAGRAFDPYRHTALHSRHVALGAKMMPAGAWQRPAYYGKAGERDACMQAEAQAVRQQVGLIDVSTLGGLDVRGPDAAELLERLYTFNFAKQPVGRSRYALMTNEHGVVIDDGVCARFADHHFYVTATTGGVDRIYQQMLKWNAQWRLDVDIANVTAALAAVNLAGPQARKVLAKLCSDLDLSADGFPYLAVRQGTVAGVKARLLRVGFVGELGYELHVPARHAGVLWDALMDAGAEFGIRPFGVETQRLLRLEKGHVIISQDTDGMTHPGEIDMQWAIGRKKPFFVGKRSVEILERQPLKRKLVGFTLPLGSERPLEGHLVLEGADISGNVTSCEYSPQLGQIIGLAYASAAQATPGGQIPIRVEGGRMVQARVVKLPFFDPDNQRQEL